MKGKITKKSVDGLGVSRGTSETILWDSEIKGFGIRTRSGKSKTYILHYRAGKEPKHNRQTWIAMDARDCQNGGKALIATMS